MRTKQNIHFENQALPVLKIRPPYITLLQKNKSVKIIKQNFSDFLEDQRKIMMTDCRILYSNEEALPWYKIPAKRCIKVYVSKYKKSFLGQKKKNDLYVENDKFPKIGEYPLKIARMVNILHMPVCPYAKIKCDIVTYNLNAYKTSTK